MNFTFKEAFISYGRRESLNFVARLHQQLKLAGYDGWFDKVNIPDGDDYAQRINHGIESAHNFVYVMAPRCLTSPYCLLELEYARLLGKRVIPINQMVIFDTPAQVLSAGDQQVLVNFYQHFNLPNPQIRTTQEVLNRSLKLVGTTDWLAGQEKLSDDDCQRLVEWAGPYENHWAKHDEINYLKTATIPVFGDSIDALEGVVERLTTLLERQTEYVHQHSEILAHALHWQNNQKTTQHLLVGTKRSAAEQWLLTEFTPPAQPSCQPSALVCEFICEARKNAENLMTDIFICASINDKPVRNELLGALSRYAKTVWTHDRDIQKGTDYQQAIKIGIENADNFIFFISPDSIASEHCQRELAYALEYNKRIIPVLITPLPDSSIPETLRGLQYIVFTENHRQTGLDEILAILLNDYEYYEWHKVLLARALKWAAAERKPAFLLRGHNLDKAKTWLRLNEKRDQHPPLSLHKDLITASETACQLGTEVFISYSRKDSDFARQLNAQLLKAGKTTWFDQESIDTGADFEKEIFKGIDSADNFLFIVSPDAVESEYCEREVNYAASLGKRFITVLHRETDPNTMPKALRIIQWLDFSDSAEFETAFLALIRALEQQQAYIHQHTEILTHALHWQMNQKAAEHLLIGEERLVAEQWLLTEFRPPNQPPCQPSPLMCDLICESRKNAENGLTDLFVCYDVQDKTIRDSVIQALSRYAKTCWRHDCDIQKGTRYDYAIEQGIEGADNFFFFISPASMASEYCQRELTHALKYHKRLVPLLVAPTPSLDMPEALQSLQYVDFTEKTNQANDGRQIDELLNILKDDQEYYKQHKVLLARAKKWAFENRKSLFLLRGHNLEMAKTWLRLSEKRQQHLPLPLHQELITASDNATRQVGTELFVSYSRKDNDFVRKLNTQLQEAGKTVWFDQETQESSTNTGSVDFEQETFKGIDHADNFVFVVSPPSVASPYCVAEINHAASQGKRIITVWYRKIDLNLMPAALQNVQKLDFSNPAEFDAIFLELVRALERQKAYLHQHTEILVHALRWQHNQKATQHLLVGSERNNAQDWLLTEFLPPNQPPCQPTPLMCDFICEARKNAENLMTDVFICYEQPDKAIRDAVVQSLSRYAKTCWTPDRDIQKGDEYDCAIEQGIEGADNFLFFISPASVASKSCQRELAHALKYHKRLVPLLIVPTPLSDMPDTLRSLQYVDFTENTAHADYDSDIEEILTILKQDENYHKQHKMLLVRALKWRLENQKPSFLLRGYNLENAKMWLRLSNKRQQHIPLELHQKLITASEAAKDHTATEVFISYSRKDSDFARELNTQLQETGKTTWFDQESISSGVDFEKEILKGIDSADNFVFVLSPDAIESEYCEREVDYAAEQSKRFISVLHRETDPTTMPDTLRKINWIDFQASPFEKSFPELVQAIELDREHAHQHTVLQQRASDWDENNRSSDFLLNMAACANAESWQQIAVAEKKQPVPTVLQTDFIIDSRKAIKKANRRRNILLASAFVGMVAAGILAVVAFDKMKEAETQKQEALVQKEKAEEQTNEALKTQSLFLADLSRQETEKGNPTNGMLLALEGLPKTFPDHDRPYVSETKNKLYQAVLESFKNYSERVVMEGDSSIGQVAFSPDGSLIALPGEGGVHLWDAHSGQRLHTLIGHTSFVNHAAFSPDGSILATASEDNTARLWALPSGKPLATLRGHDYDVIHAAFSPDGSILATASGDNTARLWALPSGKPLATLRGHSDPVIHAAFSPDGSILATASLDNTARLWALPSGKPLATLRGHTEWVIHAAFSPDGSILATASSDNTARLWALPSGKPLATLRGHERGGIHAAFSPDGSILATASRDKTARLWALPSGKPLATLRGHERGVIHAAFSPDGSILATASSDKTARLWALPSGKPLATLRGHERGVIHAAFSPDGSILATASWDKTARLWPVFSTQKLIEQATKMIPRCLTPKQREQFFLPKAPAWESIKKAEELAKTGQISAAIEQFQRAKLKAPCFQFDPTEKAQRIAAKTRLEQGEELAKQGKIQAAVVEFTQALQIDPRLVFEPENYAAQPMVQKLIRQGNELAKEGKLEEATALFQEALALDSTLSFEPEAKAKKLVAPVLVEQGQELAKQGKLEEATALFQEALALDSTLTFEPETQAKQLFAPVLVKQGQKLAKEGKLEEATAKFQEALALDSTLSFEPETQAKQLFASKLVEQGEELAYNGEIEQAIANYLKAQQMDASLDISVENWFTLCTAGHKHGQAAKVMNACTKAATIDDSKDEERAMRGFVRALTGNFQGAIEDFQFVIEGKLAPEEVKQQVLGWIDALKKGDNSFTEEVLKELR